MDKNSRIKLRLQHLIISIFYKQMFNLHIQLNGHKLVGDRGALQPHTTSRMSLNTQCRDTADADSGDLSRGQDNFHHGIPLNNKHIITNHI